MSENKNSKARIAANNRYNEKAYDRINIAIAKGKKEIIQKKAIENGESINAYINRAIDTVMNDGGGYGNNSAEILDINLSRFISHAEIEKITSLLKDGQTVDEYVSVAILDRIQADIDKANQGTDTISCMRRLANMTRKEQDEAMGIKKEIKR